MKDPAIYEFADTFECQYIRLREKEGRLYTDEEVAVLPGIGKTHPHFQEWQVRAASLNKLLSYIRKKGKASRILEVGCGNGWLSAQLALSTKADITGIDINHVELEQARRVFKNLENLRFVNDDIREKAAIDQPNDFVIFAASIQYFPSLKEIINAALKYLSPDGEIHIMDSRFYPKPEIASARNRTKAYYKSMDAEPMTEFYFHHALEDLSGFNHTFLQNPHSWKNRFSINKIHFHWVIIKN